MSVAHEDHSLDSRHRYESRPVGNVTYSPTPSAYRQEQSPEQSGPSPLASVALPTWDRPPYKNAHPIEAEDGAARCSGRWQSEGRCAERGPTAHRRSDEIRPAIRIAR